MKGLNRRALLERKRELYNLSQRFQQLYDDHSDGVSYGVSLCQKVVEERTKELNKRIREDNEFRENSLRRVK